MNTLFYGDNLKILRDYIKDESVDLVYLKEAVEKGFYQSPGWNKDYPKLQLLTVEGILAGKQVELPPNIDTFKRAQKIITKMSDQAPLFED